MDFDETSNFVIFITYVVRPAGRNLGPQAGSGRQNWLRAAGLRAAGPARSYHYFLVRRNLAQGSDFLSQIGNLGDIWTFLLIKMQKSPIFVFWAIYFSLLML